jgi:hypothetical protein
MLLRRGALLSRQPDSFRPAAALFVQPAGTPPRVAGARVRHCCVCARDQGVLTRAATRECHACRSGSSKVRLPVEAATMSAAHARTRVPSCPRQRARAFCVPRSRDTPSFGSSSCAHDARGRSAVSRCRRAFGGALRTSHARGLRRRQGCKMRRLACWPAREACTPGGKPQAEERRSVHR